jgi:enoyl-CoA hydratase/carnithine racemase
MAMVALEDQGTVAIVRLTNGVTNPIGSEMIADLSAALEEVKRRYRGLVLAGNAKFFSIGLNLPELLRLEREAMAAFWNRFEDFALGLYLQPIPTACALTGHATGGGAILALACDYRFMAEGRRLIALNEVKIGVPVPYLADLMLRQIVTDRVAVDMEFRSRFLGPDEAKAAGLADVVCAEEEVETSALERIRELAAMPPEALTLTRQHRSREISARFQSVRADLSRAFTDCWFLPSTQALLREAAQRF